MVSFKWSSTSKTTVFRNSENWGSSPPDSFGALKTWILLNVPLSRCVWAYSEMSLVARSCEYSTYVCGEVVEHVPVLFAGPVNDQQRRDEASLRSWG